MCNYYYHTLQITLKHENMEGGSLVLQFYIRNIVIFGTPCFIILSQLLTTLNYQKSPIDT